MADERDDAKKDDPGGKPVLTDGLDPRARRRIAFIMIVFGIVLVAVALWLILTEWPIQAAGVFLSLGMTILFVGVLGATGTWENKAGYKLGGSAAVFVILYLVIFNSADDSHCPYGGCKLPHIALQFVQVRPDSVSSSDIMRCLLVTSDDSTVWPRVLIRPAPSRNQGQAVTPSVASDEYFLNESNIGYIKVIPDPDPKPGCDEQLKAIRFGDANDPAYNYKMRWLSQRKPDLKAKSYELTSADQGIKPKWRHDEIIAVTVYLASPPRVP